VRWLREQPEAAGGRELDFAALARRAKRELLSTRYYCDIDLSLRRAWRRIQNER
jgi:hypothetical protein